MVVLLWMCSSIMYIKIVIKPTYVCQILINESNQNWSTFISIWIGMIWLPLLLHLNVLWRTWWYVLIRECISFWWNKKPSTLKVKKTLNIVGSSRTQLHYYMNGLYDVKGCITIEFSEKMGPHKSLPIVTPQFWIFVFVWVTYSSSCQAGPKFKTLPWHEYRQNFVWTPLLRYLILLQLCL